MARLRPIAYDGGPQRMPALNIPAEHPDAENPLLRTCAQALQRLGADVWVRHGADNAVRLCVPGDRVPPFAARAPGPMATEACRWPDSGLGGEALARVEVEGLANLLHELVHVALAGRLADDHGYDYGAIPYDLSTVDGRAVLWEEIACCVVSCAWLAGADASATTRAMDTMHEWFAEQLGIQPVFYGMEHTPAAFFATVDALAQAHIGELVAMLECAYERVERLLAPFAHDGDGRPRERLAFAPLWSRWRARTLASADEVAA